MLNNFINSPKNGKNEITRRSMSVNLVACGACCTTIEGTELGGIELQHPS